MSKLWVPAIPLGEKLGGNQIPFARTAVAFAEGFLLHGLRLSYAEGTLREGGGWGHSFDIGAVDPHSGSALHSFGRFEAGALRVLGSVRYDTGDHELRFRNFPLYSRAPPDNEQNVATRLTGATLYAADRLGVGLIYIERADDCFRPVLENARFRRDGSYFSRLRSGKLPFYDPAAFMGQERRSPATPERREPSIFTAG